MAGSVCKASIFIIPAFFFRLLRVESYPVLKIVVFFSPRNEKKLLKRLFLHTLEYAHGMYLDTIIKVFDPNPILGGDIWLIQGHRI